MAFLEVRKGYRQNTLFPLRNRLFFVDNWSEFTKNSAACRRSLSLSRLAGMISERERDEGKDLPVVGSVEEMKELMRWHEAHGLAFPAGVLRRPGRAPCEVVARDRLRALNVAEVALGFGHDAALFPAFLHGIDNEREPRLEPSLREGGRDAPRTDWSGARARCDRQTRE